MSADELTSRRTIELDGENKVALRRDLAGRECQLGQDAASFVRQAQHPTQYIPHVAIGDHDKGWTRQVKAPYSPPFPSSHCFRKPVLRIERKRPRALGRRNRLRRPNPDQRGLP